MPSYHRECLSLSCILSVSLSTLFPISLSTPQGHLTACASDVFFSAHTGPPYPPHHFLQKLTLGSFTSTYSVAALPSEQTANLLHSLPIHFLGPEATHTLCSASPWGRQVIQLCRPWHGGSALSLLCHSGLRLMHSAYTHTTLLPPVFWAQGYPRMAAGGALYVTSMLRFSPSTPGVASHTTIWGFSVATQKAKTYVVFTILSRSEPVVLSLISTVFSQPNFFFNFSQYGCQLSVQNAHGSILTLWSQTA